MGYAFGGVEAASAAFATMFRTSVLPPVKMPPNAPMPSRIWVQMSRPPSPWDAARRSPSRAARSVSGPRIVPTAAAPGIAVDAAPAVEPMSAARSRAAWVEPRDAWQPGDAARAARIRIEARYLMDSVSFGIVVAAGFLPPPVEEEHSGREPDAPEEEPRRPRHLLPLR